MKQYKSDITPFKLCENLYFVGSSKVSVHIIQTTKGLVMIDSGYPDMFDQISDSMNVLGLSPKNICAIFHTHGHIDHFGCTLKFKEICEAKTYISRIDNQIVNGTYDLSWAKELNIEPLPYFNCDVLIEEGDVFDFGNVLIRCRLTPGHTDGVISLFITINNGDKSITAAMHGGVGLNSMTREFLSSYGFSTSCRDNFREGLRMLTNEKVDLVLGNHPEQNNTIAKLKAVKEGKSLLDVHEWSLFLKDTENKLEDLIKQEAEANPLKL